MKFVPSLDGFRGLCVAAVILRHWGCFNAGWIGVQGFFVLSGFLITAILLDAKSQTADRPAQFFSIFYWRRTTRIFPLYYAFLATAAVVFLLTGYPARFASEWLSLTTYTYNFVRADQLLFDPHIEDTFYGPLWSLAVEEQFYLVWPLLVWALSPKVLKRIAIGILLAGPFLRLLTLCILGQLHGGEHYDSARVLYLLTTTHLDAFAAGGAIALGIPLFTRIQLPRLTTCTMAILGLGVGTIWLVTQFYPTDAGWIWLWGRLILQYTALNVGFAVLIVLLLNPGPLSVIFGNPALQHFGKISYGLYMLHYPCQFIVKPFFSRTGTHLAGSQGFVVGLILSTALTMAVAETSFWTLESWFLRRKGFLNTWWAQRQSVLGPGVAETGPVLG